MADGLKFVAAAGPAKNRFEHGNETRALVNQCVGSRARCAGFSRHRNQGIFEMRRRVIRYCGRLLPAPGGVFFAASA